MPEPAGTGLSRRTFLSRSAGLALAVYGASKIPLAAFEEGIAQAAPDRQDPGLGLLRRRRRRAQRAGAGRRPALRAAAAEPGARPRGAGPSSARTRRLRWHPSAAGLGDPARRGQGQRLPGDRLRRPRPVPLHLAPLLRDRRARRSASGPAGWAATSTPVGDDDNPLQGLSMDGSLSPMIATAERPVAAIDSVDGYDLWSSVSEPISEEMYRSFARFGSLPSDSPGMAQVRRATAQTDKLRTELGGVGDFTSPVAYPTTTSPTSSPACRLHRRRAADAGGDDPRPGRLRHPCRPGRRPRPTT